MAKNKKAGLEAGFFHFVVLAKAGMTTTRCVVVS
jgi:hypothetical protein